MPSSICWVLALIGPTFGDGGGKVGNGEISLVAVAHPRAPKPSIVTLSTKFGLLEAVEPETRHLFRRSNCASISACDVAVVFRHSRRDDIAVAMRLGDAWRNPS